MYFFFIRENTDIWIIQSQRILCSVLAEIIYNMQMN